MVFFIENGTKTWYDADGLLHRDNDLPANIEADGSMSWYKHGEKHRDGGLPAVIKADGSQYWYWNGLSHRGGDLPAIVLRDGYQAWYKGGQIHRGLDRPAMIWPEAELRAFYRKGKCYSIGIDDARGRRKEGFYRFAVD